LSGDHLRPISLSLSLSLSLSACVLKLSVHET
jgi:hypothetical protein